MVIDYSVVLDVYSVIVIWFWNVVLQIKDL